MTLALPDPPDSLTGAPRAFYEELREMLSVVRLTQVDTQKSSVEFDDDGVDIALVHSERADWGVWATVGESDAIVGTGWAHEHFFPPSPGVAEERPWTTQMVDFIAEILRGEIEVVTTFRGNKPVAVQHFNLDENGARQPLGRTGFLTPGRLLVWRPKRTETERMSFR
jgi:hypothetical protein